MLKNQLENEQTHKVNSLKAWSHLDKCLKQCFSCNDSIG